MIETDRSVDGVAKTIAEVLEKKKYSIDYYQREYKWESKQIAELVADLTAKFLDIYEPEHARKQVGEVSRLLPRVDHYFPEGQPAVHRRRPAAPHQSHALPDVPARLQHGRDDLVNIDELIYSEKFGEKSFNLDVADRNDCMDALFEHGEYDVPADAPESVHTLVAPLWRT
ncbi:MAG: DUF262 domain-containing protein [Marmoricola sp.]